MKNILLATTAIVAFAVQLHWAHAADIEPVGNVDYPTTFISFEGGVLFDASPSNLGFDAEDDKLGGLGSLGPGTWGGEGRFEFGQAIDRHWDYRIGLSAFALGEDTSQGTSDPSDTDISGVAHARENISLQLLDAEIGYRTDDVGALQTRLFAGLRGLHSVTETKWDYDGQGAYDRDKLGDFNDEVFALGPRIGLDLALPLSGSNVSLVGSASGSVLFGDTGSRYRFDDGNGGGKLSLWSDSETIWNVEGMAGVAFAIGKNADLTLGYRAAEFSNLMSDRSDVDKEGEFSDDGRSDLLVHGPFARLTVEIP